MLIKVKTLTGKETEVEIEPTDTVEMIKQQIQEIQGIHPDEQRLYCGGKVMKDDKLINEYHIENGSLLQLVKASRGGTL